MGGKGSSKVEVNHYHMTIHVGLCLRVDAVLKAYYGEKLYWQGYNTSNSTYTISNLGLFGGDKKEGGIAGEMTILMGKSDQVIPDKLARKLGRDNGLNAPGFRGITSILHTGPVNGQNGWLWCANSPYLKNLWYTVKHIPVSLGSEFSAIDIYKNSAEKELGPDATWKYLITSGSDTTDYSAVGIDDSGWAEGPGPFTNVENHPWIGTSGLPGNIGTLWSPTRTKIWLRKKITFEFIFDVTILILVDNFASLWVNGTKILDNFEGVVGTQWGIFTIPSSALRTGDNIFVFEARDVGDYTYIATRIFSTGDSTASDANPAHVIFDVLTNVEDGIGLDPSTSVNIESFATAAEALYKEGLGISVSWSTSTPARDFIDEILGHINGVIYDDPSTGKITLKLIRDDYQKDTLRVISPDIATMRSFSRKAWGDTINEIIVTWTNPATESEETVTLQDNGNIAEQGRVVSDSKNYYGVRNAELAWKLAARDLRVASAPLCSAEVVVNRSSWAIRPGDCVKLNWPEYGIDGLIMRVWEVSYGRRNSNGITVKLTEDVFALPVSAFVKPPVTEWVDESSRPEPIIVSEVMTLPGFVVADVAGASLTSFEYPAEFAGVLAAAPNRDTSSFDLLSESTDVTGSLEWRGVGTKQISGLGFLPGGISAEVSTTLPSFITESGPQPVSGDFILIGEGGDSEKELCLVMSVGNGDVVLRRGILDTVPKDWPAGSRAWVIGKNFLITDATQLASSVGVDYKLLSNTSVGQLDQSIAPVLSGTLSQRLTAPFRPANVLIGGQAFGVYTHETPNIPIPVTFSRRNRYSEERVIFAWDAGDVTPEPGQTTEVSIYFSNMQFAKAYSGITGTSVSLDISSLQYSTPTDANGYQTLYVELSALRGGIASLQKVVRAVKVKSSFWDGQKIEDFNFVSDGYTIPVNPTDTAFNFTE